MAQLSVAPLRREASKVRILATFLVSFAGAHVFPWGSISVYRKTHKSWRSPIRTTSPIRCGAGSAGYWTDWPGEWHSPVILKLTTEGGQVLFTCGWFLEPTPSAPQRWEHCRWWLIQTLNSVFLSSPLWTCIVAGESTSSSASSHSLNHLPI